MKILKMKIKCLSQNLCLQKGITNIIYVSCRHLKTCDTCKFNVEENQLEFKCSFCRTVETETMTVFR